MVHKKTSKVRLAHLVISSSIVLCLIFLITLYWYARHQDATSGWATYCSVYSSSCIKYPPSSKVSSYDIYGTNSSGSTHTYSGTNISVYADAGIAFSSALPVGSTYNPACINLPAETCDFTTVSISNSKISGVKIVEGVYHILDKNSKSNSFEPGYFVMPDTLVHEYGLKQGQTTTVRNFNPSFGNTQHTNNVQFLIGSNTSSQFMTLNQAKVWLTTDEAQRVKLIVASLHD